MVLNQPSRWRRFNWEHPEWWSLGLSLLAWLALLMRFDVAGIGVRHHHHAAVAGTASSFLSEILHWTIMVVAMMLPLIANSLRNVAAMNLWPRRHRAIAEFILGYLSTWLIVGSVISVAASLLKLHGYLDPRIAITISFCVAVAWQFVSIKKRALLACHRTMPISPNGWRADVDCIRYGWMIGSNCLISCWALMVMCSLSGHNIVVMLFATFVGVAERYPIRGVRGIAFGKALF